MVPTYSGQAGRVPAKVTILAEESLIYVYFAGVLNFKSFVGLALQMMVVRDAGRAR
jgi:hypothetical protein